MSLNTKCSAFGRMGRNRCSAVTPMDQRVDQKIANPENAIVGDLRGMFIGSVG